MEIRKYYVALAAEDQHHHKSFFHTALLKAMSIQSEKIYYIESGKKHVHGKLWLQFALY